MRRFLSLVWLPALFVGGVLGVPMLLIPALTWGGVMKPAHILAQDFCITQVLAPRLGDPDSYGYKSVTTDLTSVATYRTTGLILSQESRRVFTCTTQVSGQRVYLISWTID